MWIFTIKAYDICFLSVAPSYDLPNDFNPQKISDFTKFSKQVPADFFILFLAGHLSHLCGSRFDWKKTDVLVLNLFRWNLKFQDFFHSARWAYFENLVAEILYILHSFFAFPPTLNHSEFPCFSFLVLWQNFYVNVEKIKNKIYRNGIQFLIECI